MLRRVSVFSLFALVFAAVIVHWTRSAPSVVSSGGAAPSTGFGFLSMQPVKSDAVAAVGSTSQVTDEPFADLAHVPTGRFKDSLLALSTADQGLALASIKRLVIPTEDLDSLRASTDGHLYFVCDIGQNGGEGTKAARYDGSNRVLRDGASGAKPLAQDALKLHSKPGSTHVLYLDFHGGEIQGTAWNTDNKVTKYIARQWGNYWGTSDLYDPSLQNFIYNVWKQVMEDFAPFDLDVTTETPSAYNPQVGRVLITYSVDANGQNMPNHDAGGVAYIDCYGNSDYVSKRSPAFVYADHLGNDEYAIGYACSHEFGHNLGLSHDGLKAVGSVPKVEYYKGHGVGETSWAPIMGGGYGRSVVQWSKGEYYNSNNSQDDIAIIAGKTGYRADVLGHTLATALTPPVIDDTLLVEGVIRKTSESAVYAFEAGAGPIAVSAFPVSGDRGIDSPNLDVKLELLDQSGAVVATSQPVESVSAGISVTGTDQKYYVRVTSDSFGDPLSIAPWGYTVYGSLGHFLISGSFVASKPIINSPLEVTARTYDPFVYQVSATNFPTSFTASPLPPGFTFDSKTGTLSATPHTTGDYTIQLGATNRWGTATASLHLVFLYNSPRILSETAASRNLLKLGDPFSLGVEIGSDDPEYTLQWRHNGRPIPGATSKSYSFPHASKRDAGWYELIATNSGGTTLSKIYFVNVAPPKTEVISWMNGISLVPPGLKDQVIDASADELTGLVINADGTGRILGYMAGDLELSVAQNAVAVSAASTYSRVLQSDGTVKSFVSYWNNFSSLKDIVMLKSDGNSSGYNLTRDGHVIYVGWNSTDNALAASLENVVDMDAAGSRIDVIYRDGTCVSVGSLGANEVRPPPVEHALKVATTSVSSFVLLENGSVVKMGSTVSDILATDVVDIEAYSGYAIALKEGGSVEVLENSGTLYPAVIPFMKSVVAASGFIFVRDNSGDAEPKFTQQPLSRSASSEDTVVFEAQVDAGTSYLSYTWRKDGVVIPGATGPTLTLNQVGFYDEGSYEVTVYGSLGSATSLPAVLTIAGVPKITTQSNRVQFYRVDSPVDFFVTASGTGDLTYQWFHNALPIPGATTSALHLDHADVNAAGAYSVDVTDSQGTRTALMFLRRGSKPTQLGFVDQSSGFPTLETRLAFGHSEMKLFGPYVVSDTGGVSYYNMSQIVPVEASFFRKPVYDVAGGYGQLGLYTDGRVELHHVIPTALDHKLLSVIAIAIGDFLSAALTTDGKILAWDNYSHTEMEIPSFGQRVTAIAAAGSSLYALLADGTVGRWSAISDLAEQDVPAGLDHVVRLLSYSSVVVAVKDTGEAVAWGRQAPSGSGLSHVLELSYNTALFEDGTLKDLSSQKTIPNVISIAGGSYLRSANGDTIPVFDVQPGPIIAGEGNDRVMTVKGHAGSNDLFAQWRKNGVPIPGQTGFSLDFRYLRKSDEGDYDVLLSNDLGTVGSLSVSVIVTKGPAVTATSPVNQIVKQGAKLSLSVTASGSGPVVYQWFKDNAAIEGATSPQFSVAQMSWKDAGRYRVVISDNIGKTVRLFNVNYAANRCELVYLNYSGQQIKLPGNYPSLVDVVLTSQNLDFLKADGVLSRWNFNFTTSDDLVSGVGALTGNGLCLRTDGSATYIDRYLGTWLDSHTDKWVKIYGRFGLSADGFLYQLDGTSPLDEWRAPGDIVDFDLLDSSAWHPMSVTGAGTIHDSNVAGVTEKFADLYPIKKIVYPSYNNVGLMIGLIQRVNGELWSFTDTPFRKELVTAHSRVVRRLSGATQWIDENGVPSGDSIPAGDFSHSYALTGYPPSFVVLRDISDDAAPRIVVPPANRSVTEGTLVTFSVSINPEAVRCAYQWRKDGVNLTGATNTTFVVGSAEAKDVGNYDVVVTNLAGTATSAKASLTLLPAPTVTALSSVRQVVKSGDPLELKVTASGKGNMSYQWYLEGQPIPGATSSTYARGKMTALDAGLYRVEVTDENGTGARLMRVVYRPLKARVAMFDVDYYYHSTISYPVIDDTIYALGCGSRYYISYAAGASLSWPDTRTELSDVIKWADDSGDLAALKADGTVWKLTDVNLNTWTKLAVTDCVDVFPAAGLGWLVLHSDGSVEGPGLPFPALKRVQSLIAGYNNNLYWTRWNGTVGSWNPSTPVPQLISSLTDAATIAGYADTGMILRRDGTMVHWGNWHEGTYRNRGRSIVRLLSGYFLVDFKGAADQIEFTSGYYGTSHLDHFLDAGNGDRKYMALLDGTPDVAPNIVAHPVSVTRLPGENVTLSTAANGEHLQYQWYRDGVAIDGATAATLTVSGIQNSDAGRYVVVVSNAFGSSTSRPATVALGAPEPGRIRNLSVRAFTGSTPSPLIVGFVMNGGSKDVLVRAVGPALGVFNVAGTMPDPQLAIHQTTGYGLDEVVGTNDNWGDNGAAASMAQLFGLVGAFQIADGASKDAAILASVDGARTVQVFPVSGSGPGNVLVEAYDAGTGTAQHLVNVSARNFAGGGDDALIAGFVIDGTEPKNVLIRGVGPTLATWPFNVTGVLNDPMLDLHTSIQNSSNQWVDTIVASNDDWGSEPGVAAAAGASGAFALQNQSKDAAILVTLPAGAYTAVVRSADGGTGEALVEIYEVP